MEELKNCILICANCHQSLSFKIPDIEYNQNIILPLSETCGWGQQLYDINSFKINNNLSGKNIKVAVMDSGIYDHKDLVVKKHIDFTDGKKMHNHGTFVAGIIAAQQNDFGICGIAPEVELYDIRVLDNNGLCQGYKTIERAFEWCIDHQIDIINCSFGSPQVPPQSLIDIIESFEGIVCAASGNSGLNLIDYPAAIKKVIAVGSIGQDGKKANYSNYGYGLDLELPGSDILSCGEKDNYYTASGTSFAAPFMTGLTALLLDYGLKNIEAIISKAKSITTIDR